MILFISLINSCLFIKLGPTNENIRSWIREKLTC